MIEGKGGGEVVVVLLKYTKEADSVGNHLLLVIEGEGGGKVAVVVLQLKYTKEADSGNHLLLATAQYTKEADPLGITSSLDTSDHRCK